MFNCSRRVSDLSQLPITPVCRSIASLDLQNKPTLLMTMFSLISRSFSHISPCQHWFYSFFVCLESSSDNVLFSQKKSYNFQFLERFTMISSLLGLCLLLLCAIIPTPSHACETLVHFEKLVDDHKNSKETCNRQNFNLHFVCSLLTAQNFRK